MRPWYRISNAAAGPARVDIYDEIGGGDLFSQGVSASGFVADLADVKGDLEVHINSPGGNVFDGLAIYNAIAQRQGRVTTVVDGLAASAASFIAQAGKTRVVAPGAMLMIHDAHGLTVGDAGDHRETAGLLDKASDNIADLYAAHSGRPAAGWREAMRAESWYTAQEAVDAGLADRLAERPADPETLAVAAKAAVRVWAKVPDWVRERAGDAQEEPEPQALTADAVRAVIREELVTAGLVPGPDGYLRDLAIFNAEKYSADDRKAMASKGHAMPDGSYPIEDEEDLHNAIRAVGRGGSDHDAIRRHIIKRAKALGKSDAIPDNWNADGSIGGDTSNHAGMPAWLRDLTAKEAATR